MEVFFWSYTKIGCAMRGNEWHLNWETNSTIQSRLLQIYQRNAYAAATSTNSHAELCFNENKDTPSSMLMIKKD